MKEFGFWTLSVFLLITGCNGNTSDSVSIAENDSAVASVDSVESEEEEEMIIQTPDSIDIMLGLGKIEFGDLDSMIARRHIRVLVPFSPTFYYWEGKEIKGLALEEVNLFEKYVHRYLRLRYPTIQLIIKPVSREHIIRLLNEGHGDIAIAGLAINEARSEMVDFSTPTITGISEVLVASHDADKIESLADLSGKRVHVHLSSDYYLTLKSISDSLVTLGLDPINIIAADPFLDDEDLLQMVNASNLDYTVMMKEAAEHWNLVLDSMKVYADLPLKTGVSMGWAMRKNSPKLKEIVDHFVRQNKKGTLTGNILFKKYFVNKPKLKNVTSKAALKRMHDTKAIFQKYADEYEMDWLFMVAQGYQESGLNHNRRSHAGAVGIMQVKPSTAAGSPIYIHNIWDIDNNIHASAKYMNYIRTSYLQDSTISPLDRQLLALASYNAGPNRIRGLRRRAEARGLDPNVWFDNVEIMASHSIGRETTTYVSNIYKYYAAYHTLQQYGEFTDQQVIP